MLAAVRQHLLELRTVVSPRRFAFVSEEFDDGEMFLVAKRFDLGFLSGKGIVVRRLFRSRDPYVEQRTFHQTRI